MENSALFSGKNGSLLRLEGRDTFLLGIQPDCDGCYTPKGIAFAAEHARRLCCNALVAPVYWRQLEAQEGRYDLKILDCLLKEAQKQGLKLVLVWFGAFKNAAMTYAPEFVRADGARFHRAQRADGSVLRQIACPACGELLRKDCAAVEAMAAYLAREDKQHTVVLFQSENETGLLETERCHCPACEEAFIREGWECRYGSLAEEAFSASAVCRYDDAVAAAFKRHLNIPVYVNAWLRAYGGANRAGKTFPSGGPLPEVHEIYRREGGHIDFYAPDVYQPGYRSFQRICADYTQNGNPLYIAEHATGKGARAEKNVFYALQRGALGFSPWAVDMAFPDVFGAPLVHPVDGRWSEEAYALRDSFLVIAQAIAPLLRGREQGTLRVFVQEEAETGALMDFGDVLCAAEYCHRSGDARGFVLRLGAKDFLLGGMGVLVRFYHADGRPLGVLSAQKGRYEGEEWVMEYPVRREQKDPCAPMRRQEAGIVRLTLEEGSYGREG